MPYLKVVAASETLAKLPRIPTDAAWIGFQCIHAKCDPHGLVFQHPPKGVFEGNPPQWTDDRFHFRRRSTQAANLVLANE